MSQNYSVVIDNGSGYSKAGLSGQEAPRNQFRTIVGKPKMPSIMVGMDQKQAYVGEEAQSKKGVLILKNPINNGFITNWEDITKIWHHTYYSELRDTPQQHPCLLTQTPRNPKTHRQKMTEIMFQTFNVPSLYIANQSVLALYSSGRTTGLVLDSGEGVTSTVPIYQGYALPHAIQRNNFAGKQLTQYFHKLLAQAGLKFSLSAQYQIIQKIKNLHAYVALDYNHELKQYQQTNRNDCAFTLPDGQSITLGNQRFKCAEPLFDPVKFGFQMPAFHQMIYQSIMKCDIDVRKDLYSNIILSGGTSMLPGLNQRLAKQFQNLVPAGTKTNIIGPPDRQFLTWIGGSILSSLGTFQAMWISKSQFQQHGVQIIHKKCF